MLGALKTELINDKADKILKDIDKSKDYFINTLTEILENGCKVIIPCPLKLY